ncbi:uncharacterized protein LOC114298237 [Camellia sinensis]|uniref:uncharacterized protein LOC114298237 n=1 Tax=Camellia sinensis TaxID=4442 RepID=UPI001035AFB0|nr:uncharacterized protein LOC114298237 [Camellia sinensis]
MLASQPWPTPCIILGGLVLERKVETCNSESAARGDKRYQQLEGAINDCLIGEAELAQYFLAILNLSDEYKQWSKLSTTASEKLSDDKVETLVNSELDKRRKQYATDHTQSLTPLPSSSSLSRFCLHRRRVREHHRHRTRAPPSIHH